MSQYGSPPDPEQPQDPYGAPPNPYGSPQQPSYGGNPNLAPYGGQPNVYGGAAPSNYAGWLARVGASIIDGLLGALAGLPLWIGYGIAIGNTTKTTNPDGTTSVSMHGGGASLVLILLGVITSIAFFIWNVCIRQGRTGQTIGKGVLAIRLLGRDGTPIGAGLSFVRQLAHILDSICYIGYLWPLWDSKKQTFADKIMGTVVVHAANTGQA